MKKLFVISAAFWMVLMYPSNAARRMGSNDIYIPYFSSTDSDNYKIQKENELTFIYTYPDGKKDTYTKIQIFPNGMTIVPDIGEVDVVGKTEAELRKTIQDTLGPDIKIEIFIYRIPDNVSVLGEVRTPGSYTHDNIKTVYDAIAKAGGFTKVAKKTEVTLIRQRVDGTRVSYFIDFPKEVFKAYEPGTGVGEDVYVLKEGDLIFVPTSRWKQIGYFALSTLNIATLGLITGVFTGVVSGMIND